MRLLQASIFFFGLLSIPCARAPAARADNARADNARADAGSDQAPRAADATRADGGSDDAAATRWFQEGIVAYRAGRWEEARIALRQAFEAKPQANIAFNLGLAEFKAGRFVDAAEHLSYYLRYQPNASDREREVLKAAEKRVGILSIAVSEAGAAVWIDDVRVGTSPLPPRPVYVAPGLHTVRATKAGRPEGRQIRSVVAGESADVVLELDGAGADRQGTPPASSPSASGLGVGAGAALRFDRPPPAEPTAPWFASPRNVALVATAGLAVAGLAIGVVYRIQAGQADGRVGELAAQIDGQRGSSGCAGVAGGSCADLANERDWRNEASRISTWSFAVSGVCAAAAAALWLWPTHSSRASSSVHVLPGTVDGRGPGLAVAGSF